MSSSRSVFKAHEVEWAVDDPRAVVTPAPFGVPETSLSDRAAEIVQGALVERDRILREAQDQAESLLRAAREQAGEISRQARMEGAAAAEAEADRLVLTARGVLDELRAWRASVLAENEKALLELAVDVARTVFGPGVTLDTDTLHAAFARALAEARPLGPVRVRVHPDDAAVLGPRWPDQQTMRTGQRLELVPDPAIRRGGCFVEGESGYVDARVESQLDVAVEALRVVAADEVPGPSGAGGGT